MAGGDGFTISPNGYDWLVRVGLVPPHPLRRILLRSCLDWTEGMPHLAGWPGAAICERLETVGSLKSSPKGRALHVTPKGRVLLSEYFGLA